MVSKSGWISIYLDNYFTGNDEHLDRIKFEIRFLIFDQSKLPIKKSFLISFINGANAKLFEKTNSRRKKRDFDNDEEDLGPYLSKKYKYYLINKIIN